MLKRLDHVSIGVADIDKAETLFTEILGGELLPDFGESAEGFSWLTFMLGGKKLELVTPEKMGEGGVGSYLAKHGEGFHHLSFSVEDLAQSRDYFESKGLRVLSYSEVSPTFKHFYLHPKDTFGALIQVFEENTKTVEMSEPSD